MALKTRNGEGQTTFAEKYRGPWGEIVHEEIQCVHFVRDYKGVEEIWTYPYEALLRWVFKKSTPEEIEILAGGDTITIRGYGLEKFLEPLEKRYIVRVEQRTIRFAAPEPNDCCVTEILIESNR
jgi:hypothetical protein